MVSENQSYPTCFIHDPMLGKWLSFDKPRQVLAADTIDQVLPVLQAVQHQVASHGMYAAGFVSYEAGPAFDPALAAKPAGDLPLAWFGIYHPPLLLDELPSRSANPEPLAWLPNITEAEYRRAINKIKGLIASGDTYQVNFTMRLHARLPYPPWDLFLAMIAAQGSHYGAYIHTDEWSICSASPELFFEVNGDVLISKPMKGTARRGLWQQDDRARARRLQHSVKNRAENVMIVDMVRNDLGRLAQTGTVKVSGLFDIEKYPTLWQMTSTVTCQATASLPQVFKALFPPASITGAPKVRTTQIIAELESAPRQVYTGAIGYVSPTGRTQFNVAIRTVLVDHRSGVAEYGVGGGIVWDSTGQREYEECQVKARVLTHREADFALLETLLWTPDVGYHWLKQHLDRLSRSGEYFSRNIDRMALRELLADFAQGFTAEAQRVRLVVPESGKAYIEAAPIQPLPAPYRLRLARSPVNSGDRFLYHKTTCRQVYEQALAEAPGGDDVLLWNEHGEITESSIANVLVELDGALFTPPIRCGLLPGIYRHRLLKDGKLREKTIKLVDLSPGSTIYLVNSVRGIWKATLVFD